MEKIRHSQRHINSTSFVKYLRVFPSYWNILGSFRVRGQDEVCTPRLSRLGVVGVG